MRRVYITVTALALAMGIGAQTQDTLLRRQLELERNFNPTLLDANKITSLPALREPTVQKANTNYSTWAGRVTPPLEIALPKPGEIMTAIPYNTKKGHLAFYAGNYANLDGLFGYRLLESQEHQLGFTFLHNSTNGDVNFVQSPVPEGNNAYAMDNTGRLKYHHAANEFALDMQFSYLDSRFNYYGNSFETNRHFNNEKQRLGVMNARVGLETDSPEKLNLNGFVDFKNFTTKFGDMITVPGIKGNQVHAQVGIAKPFREGDHKVGVNGSLFSTLYKGDLPNYTHLNAAPYLQLGGLNWDARVGVDVLFKKRDGLQVRVVPNAGIQWGVTDRTSLYARVHGGYNPNTYLCMLEESRHVAPFGSVKPSFTLLNLEGGVKIGEVSGFRFDIRGGFSKTDDAHFLLLNGGQAPGDASNPFIEVLRPVYANLSHSFIGGGISTNVYAPLYLSLRVKKSFYNVASLTINEVDISDPKAYNKPGIELDVQGTWQATNSLKFTAGYRFEGDRWSYFNGKEIEMGAINDLNVGAVYAISDAFSLNVKANNLLFQHYDIWYGYPAQGFNASGGFTFSF